MATFFDDDDIQFSTPPTHPSSNFLARLQSVTTPPTSFGVTALDDGGDGDSPDDLKVDQEEDVEEEINAVKRLGRAWVKERGLVDIARWEGELVEDCLEKLGQQVSPYKSIVLIANHQWYKTLTTPSVSPSS